MSKLQQSVTAFMKAIGQPVGDAPKVPADKSVRLRLRLIAEEFVELLEASLGGESADTGNLKREVFEIIDTRVVDVDLPEYADALADLAYVVSGGNVDAGIDGDAVLSVVHAANMAKLGGPVDEHGKQKKPAGWQPPDIDAELRRQGWDGK